MKKLVWLLLALVLAGFGGSTAGAAEPFAVKSIKIVVPFPAGGATDILARFVAKYLGDELGVTTVVENRAGASGTIGSDAVAKSEPDGSVLLLTATHHVINPSLYRKLPYDTQKDFSPIAMVASVPNALIVTKDFPAQNVQELIAMAKKEPGKYSFGSTGIGGANHLSGEMFKQMAGVDIVHIPYKGAAPAMNDLIGGHIPIMFDALTTVIPASQGGVIRVLAVTTLTRAPALPEVPTLDESGLKGFESIGWFGLYMPQAHDNPAYQRLVAAMTKILAASDTRQKFATLSAEPGTLTGAAFASFVDSEIKKWNGVVRAANVPPE
ncbi:tripartite-type tricarboxylate transporter receptor subunit TctC [Rhodopseudomonas rhenobacensis]|uniref:Tripartite-type tricarboxylate transporter receptor subunit TctC n=1 Tax=Rhodopseudomonas rhenobacensis TaxID=87461 RepID=A0A7W7Z468_9BRAD|nr:tripartite tricarboxylate transporter substrate binding protein [Rhodopseudomonas rhenobacensis]MBB5047475.1 tripartite-type tricarboxylate transporter receptor subunit TctC [Rhodopseudomonas rhenobacensis]